MLSGPVALEAPRLGLHANWQQFALLVLVNGLVGGMVGLERTVVPLIGSNEFRIASETVIFTFIIAFGLVKAVTNLASGILADRLTRKSVLVAGWAIALPVPFMLGWGPTWGWIVAANVLLGISQGLTWSMTVIMKIDLVGPQRRGLAMGLNEFAGYGMVGITALLTGLIAAQHGLRPAPFLIGVVYAVAGLALSIALVRDTTAHADLEGRRTPSAVADAPTVRWVVLETSWRNRTLFGISQAGLVNNLNDGMSWGVFPLLFAAHGVPLAMIGVIKAVYPGTWSLGQLVTGPLADRFGRKPLVVAGMLLQAAAHAVIGLGIGRPLLAGLVGSVMLGIGTAMVYPALLAAVADVAPASYRATSLGVYRCWRDLGYAVGALLSGFVAQQLGLVWAIHVAGLLTCASGLLAWRIMRETRPPVQNVGGIG
jgi:MFS family permease